MDLATFEDWGPYTSFGTDASTEIRIAWKSHKYSHSRTVWYGKTPDCDQTAEDQWVHPNQSHVVKLTGLTPNTKYYYKIAPYPKKVYSFKTGPAPGDRIPFNFNVMGDMHASPTNNLQPGFEAALRLTPDHDFGVAVGDSINDGNDPTHWNAFFAGAAEYLTQKTLMNATGNHDTGNDEKYCRFLAAWPHPYVNPKAGAYYAMEYGNAVFIFLDSSNAGGIGEIPSDDQLEWLEATLQKYAKQDRWIFMFLHHQIFSTGDFGCAYIMEEIYRNLAKEYHIDAIFYGHDHHYECYWVDRDADYGGTLYFVTGAHGGHQYVDYNIQWDRQGKTKYIWPGRILNVRKHGVPPLYPGISGGAKDFRNDAIVGSCQLLGVLEPHFVNVSINGDDAEIKAIGWQHQLFHHIKLKRAGAGRKYTPECELTIYGDK
jgi:predicted phosphodiesterase